jgi:hypothetical protein
VFVRDHGITKLLPSTLSFTSSLPRKLRRGCSSESFHCTLAQAVASETGWPKWSLIGIKMYSLLEARPTITKLQAAAKTKMQMTLPKVNLRRIFILSLEQPETPSEGQNGRSLGLSQ